MCNSKKSKFLKEQEARGFLGILGMKTPLSQTFVLFCFNSTKQVNTRYKMNKIINKLSLAGDKFMPEMHLSQPDLHIVLVVHSRKVKKDNLYDL